MALIAVVLTPVKKADKEEERKGYAGELPGELVFDGSTIKQLKQVGVDTSWLEKWKIPDFCNHPSIPQTLFQTGLGLAVLCAIDRYIWGPVCGSIYNSVSAELGAFVDAVNKWNTRVQGFLFPVATSVSLWWPWSFFGENRQNGVIPRMGRAIKVSMDDQ